MKVLLFIIMDSFLFLAYGQNEISLKHIDTNVCNYTDEIHFDSLDFLKVELDYSCRTQIPDKKFESNLIPKFNFSNIDTLIIEFFNINYNVFELLANCKNVGIIRLIGNDTLILENNSKLSENDMNNIKGTISLELYAKTIKIDLNSLNQLGIRCLWIDVEQEKKMENIILNSYCSNIENVFISHYFPRYRKFIRQNKKKFLNSNVFVIRDSFTLYPEDVGKWPKR